MKFIEIYEHPAFSLALAFIAFVGIIFILVSESYQEEQEYRERLEKCESYNEEECSSWKCKSILAKEYDRKQDELSFEVSRNQCLLMEIIEGTEEKR